MLNLEAAILWVRRDTEVIGVGHVEDVILGLLIEGRIYVGHDERHVLEQGYMHAEEGVLRESRSGHGPSD